MEERRRRRLEEREERRREDRLIEENVERKGEGVEARRATRVM